MAAERTAVVTHVSTSPVDDRVRRMWQYSIAMAIRLACFGLIFAVPGWWKLLPITGAALLPYYAVVIANLPHRAAAEFQPVVAPAISARRPGESGETAQVITIEAHVVGEPAAQASDRPDESDARPAQSPRPGRTA